MNVDSLSAGNLTIETQKLREEIRSEILPELEAVIEKGSDQETINKIAFKVRTAAEAKVEAWLQTIEIRFGRDFHRVLRESFGINLDQFGIPANKAEALLKEIQRAKDAFGMERDTLQRKEFMDALFEKGFWPVYDHEQFFVMMLAKMTGIVVHLFLTDSGKFGLSFCYTSIEFQ